MGLLAVVLTVGSCYFDNEEELYPPCQPVGVSFREDVEPILQARCYGCHSLENAPSQGDGINLEGYFNFYTYSTDFPDRLIGSLEWNGNGAPMPKDDSKLDQCSINKIETWINEGARNN